MPVRFLRGFFLKFDGVVADDFQAVAIGVVTVIPQVTGTSNCILFEGTFLPRQ